MADAPVIVKFRRHSRLVKGALLLAVIPGMSLFGWTETVLPWAVRILPVLIAVAVWAWRPGTDASVAGLVVRGLFGSRKLPWSAISGLAADDAGRVSAQLTAGEQVGLPAVRAEDLPTLEAVAAAPAEASESVRGLPPRMVARTDWRLVAVLVGVYLAFFLTMESAQVQRLVPIPVGDGQVRQLPAGGWPIAYLYDSPCCSVIGSLGLEDRFEPGRFAVDEAAFGVLPVLVGLVAFGVRPRRRSPVLRR
jgi:hypothetical protein